MSFSNIENDGAWVKGGTFTFDWTPEYESIEAKNLYVSGSPTPAQFSIGATLEGQTSHATCTVIYPQRDLLGYTSYDVKNLSGTFQVGETISDGTNTIAGDGECPFIGTEYSDPPFGENFASPIEAYTLLQDGFIYYTLLEGYEDLLKLIDGSPSLGQILFSTDTETEPTVAGTPINDLIDAGLASIVGEPEDVNGDGTLYRYTVQLSADIPTGTYYLKAADATWELSAPPG